MCEVWRSLIIRQVWIQSWGCLCFMFVLCLCVDHSKPCHYSGKFEFSRGEDLKRKTRTRSGRLWVKSVNCKLKRFKTNNTSKTDEAPWCYSHRWDWISGRGGVMRYRASTVLIIENKILKKYWVEFEMCSGMLHSTIQPPRLKLHNCSALTNNPLSLKHPTSQVSKYFIYKVLLLQCFIHHVPLYHSQV